MRCTFFSSFESGFSPAKTPVLMAKRQMGKRLLIIGQGFLFTLSQM
jgi:hypothetical protein